MGNACASQGLSALVACGMRVYLAYVGICMSEIGLQVACVDLF